MDAVQFLLKVDKKSSLNTTIDMREKTLSLRTLEFLYRYKLRDDFQLTPKYCTWIAFKS